MTTKSPFSFLGRIALLGAVALLCSCQIIPEAKVDPTQFFLLNGLAPVSQGATEIQGRLQVGLRPVDVPEYLRRTRSMVVRLGTNQVRLQDEARWAETLDGGVNRVLRDRLLQSDKVAGVYTHPFPGAIKRDYDVTIRLLRCEGAQTADGQWVARFSAAYEIVAGDASGRVVARRTFAASELPWNGQDFGALAAALSQGALQLSEAIAGDLPAK